MQMRIVAVIAAVAVIAGVYVYQTTSPVVRHLTLHANSQHHAGEQTSARFGVDRVNKPHMLIKIHWQ